MNYLNIRVIINGNSIYTLSKNQPVIIPISQPDVSVVATDGFHITRPLSIAFHKSNTYHFKIVCAIDNDLFITGAVLLVLLFAVGLFSDILIFRLLSLVPIFYFLFYYYINRKEFLQIKAA
ncbi:MAG TPA: hypothetical protein VM935_03995 [Chitinophagaceae bacterium]|jgi:hypothetical protein|nr:hypothetical protein [Chitinophagaceae bacterium]